jgi:hypothetical protein
MYWNNRNYKIAMVLLVYALGFSVVVVPHFFMTGTFDLIRFVRYTILYALGAVLGWLWESS